MMHRKAEDRVKVQKTYIESAIKICGIWQSRTFFHKRYKKGMKAIRWETESSGVSCMDITVF
jgi:hypothetical protein